MTPMRPMIGTRWRLKPCHRNSVPESHNVTARIPAFMGDAQPIPQMRATCLVEADAVKQIPGALFRAYRIKHWIHGEIRHPDSTITIGSLKPFVRLLFIIESGVDLCDAVWRNIAFDRNVLQLTNGAKGFLFLRRDLDSLRPGPCKVGYLRTGWRLFATHLNLPFASPVVRSFRRG